MLVTKKMLIALTLVGALLGAGIGTLITRSTTSASAAKTSYDNTPTTNASEKTPDQIAAENSAQFSTTQEQTAYRQGLTRVTRPALLQRLTPREWGLIPRRIVLRPRGPRLAVTRTHGGRITTMVRRHAEERSGRSTAIS